MGSGAQTGKTHRMNEEYEKSVSTRARPGKGDRVKLKGCSVLPTGVIVDEVSQDYVSVKWDDLPRPATYRRSGVELDERNPP